MADDGNRVDVDTSQLVAAVRKLGQSLPAGGKAAARLQAETTARAVAAGVPRRTGRLAGSVRVIADGDGFGVSYGEGIPYAAYIERREGAVESGVEGTDDQFARAMQTVADQAVRRL